MYRLVEKGEITLCDDEYWQADRWHTWGPYHAGHPLVLEVPVRRLVKPAVTPAAESVKPAPVVSVGDRVKVLSGPWAGCTGVVMGFEVEVTLSGYGKMTARKDSVPVVEMDYVRVGGQRLSVKESKVEKLPPVVPEVLYRPLELGELIRKGDQVLNCFTFGWQDNSVSAGKRVGGLFDNRRPVRVQSPGWRYLDVGETVQAGDETEYSARPYWRCASGCLSYLGRVLDGHETYFRRKLPANVGG